MSAYLLKANRKMRLFILFGLALAVASVSHVSKKLIPISHAQDVVPFREEVFSGEISPPDYYYDCQIDSHGNLFLISHMSMIEKIAVDGSPSFTVNFGGVEQNPPIGIHSYTIAADDSVLVAGVDHDKSGTVIYRIPVVSNIPILYAKLNGIEPASCAFGSDGSLHLMSLDSVAFKNIENDLRSKKNPRNLPAGADVLVRRLRPDIDNYRGYYVINSPSTLDELEQRSVELGHTFLSTDPDGNVHMVNYATASHKRITPDGMIATSEQLNLLGDRKQIVRVMFIGTGYFIAQIAELKEGVFIKAMHVIVGREGSAWTKELDLPPFTMPVYLLSWNARADQLLQYYIVDRLIYTRRYRVSEILHALL